MAETLNKQIAEKEAANKQEHDTEMAYAEQVGWGKGRLVG